ncbi:dentin sialophosphoprotein-like isoform X1 [Vespula maculifrons]|uniref:Dentin sialophosphoprotein-like isoform X1 n=1 Tax=Vespula maculifrons TaxID=7453 RepID=A0ABD2B4W8_VESMC
MKERWSCSEEKLVSAEEGLKPNKSVIRGKTYCCQRFMQYVKLIFLILLIFFIGWSGYILWKAYDHGSIDLYIFESSFTRYREGESSKIIDKLSSSALNKSEETLETTTRPNISLKEDVSLSEIYPIDNQLITTMKTPESSIKQDISLTNFENTNAEEATEDSFKSSRNDIDEQMKTTESSLDKDKTKEDEKSAEESVIEWSFPLIWSIHRETGPFMDDYLEEIRNAELDAMLKEMSEKNEKDEESNEFSKFQEKFFEKEDLSDDQNDENNGSYEKDLPSSIEIFDNLKKLHDSIDAMIKDLHVKNRQSDDDLWQSEESSIKDETSNHLVLGLDRQDSIETPPSILGEDSEITKSSLFHDSLIEEDPYDYLLGNHDHSYLESSTLSSLERVDSEKSDTSKVDDARSDLKAESFESLGWDPSWDPRQGIQWRKQYSSIETSPTDESTERHIFADVSTAAIEENDDDTIKTFLPWRFYVDPAISSSMENVNSEKEIVYINSRTGDPKEGVICTIQIINGLSLLKCSSNSFDTESFTEQSNDRPFGSSSYSTANSKSDTSTEQNDESFPNHYSSFVEVDTTENSLNDMTSNKNIDIGDSVIEPTEIPIDSKNLESEKSDINTGWWMKSESSTNAYFQDNSSEAIKDPIYWWLDVNKYRTKQMSGEETIERKRRGIAKIMSGQSTF